MYIIVHLFVVAKKTYARFTDTRISVIGNIYLVIALLFEVENCLSLKLCERWVNLRTESC